MKQTVYLILFRGIGGKTQLPVDRLRKALTAAGFTNVATYINSGNAIVRSPLPRARVVAAVADVCREKFGYDKAIFARTRAEWERMIASNPFAAEADAAPATVHAALLAARPDPGRIKRLREGAGPGERIEIVGNVAWLHTPHGFGTSKLGEKFDRGIGVTNTARNWNTVRRLAGLAKAAEES